MPAKVANIAWKCHQCGKRQWLKPGTARKKKYCSRACLHKSMRVEHPVRVKQSQKLARYGERICEQCGTVFEAKTKAQRFCSQGCSFARTKALRVSQMGAPTVEARPCETCGALFTPRDHLAAGRFCSRPCYYAGNRGEKSSSWRGGRHVTADGYVKVYAPDHDKADPYGYVSEHRKVMEEMLDRPLDRTETVHHVNGDKTDNRPENLQLRSGRHGKGWVHQCADCGSQNIIKMPI